MRLAERVRMYLRRPVEPSFEPTRLEEDWWDTQAGRYGWPMFLQASGGTVLGYLLGGLGVATWRWTLGAVWQLPRHFLFWMIAWEILTVPMIWLSLLKKRKYKLLRSKRLREAMLLKDPGDFT